MLRPLPWIAAIVVWNLTFDYQVRMTGNRFVSNQLVARQQGEPLPLIRDVFRPAVARAALVSTGVAGVVLAGGLISTRRHRRQA